VDSLIDGLPVDPDTGVWKRAASAKNGLAWVASGSESIDGGTAVWDSDTIKGTAPTGKTAYLADVVGSRTVTVKATVCGKDSSAATFTFGKGPLSVFSKTSAGALEWLGYSNSYPAAEFCGGTVVGNVVITDTVSSTSAGFDPSASGGWSNAYAIVPGWWLVRYAENSKLPKLEQLLAVGNSSGYSGYSEILGKGASLAAGWVSDSRGYATGELAYTNGNEVSYPYGAWAKSPGFVTFVVRYFNNGYSAQSRMSNPSPTLYPAFVACVN
jgi:hypothetical protein